MYELSSTIDFIENITRRNVWLYSGLRPNDAVCILLKSSWFKPEASFQVNPPWFKLFLLLFSFALQGLFVLYEYFSNNALLKLVTEYNFFQTLKGSLLRSPWSIRPNF